MDVRKKKLVIAMLAVALVATPISGSAFIGEAMSGKLDEVMEDMFGAIETSTSAQPYSSNTRNGYYGGSYSLRVPVKNYSLVQFDAPTMSAGCSGISLSAGSFSVLNADEFKQMIRQIGANAGMYFFKLALDVISPRINAVITSLEKFMQSINLNNINTCKAGETLVNAMRGDGQAVENISSAIDGGIKAFGTVVRAAENIIPDRTGDFNKPKEEILGAIDPKKIPGGNMLWRLIIQKQVAESVGTAAVTPDVDLMREYMMSMVGTLVLVPAGGLKDKDGNKLSADCTTGECVDENPVYKATKTVGISVNSLYQGGDGTQKYWACGNSGRDEMQCHQPEPKVFDFKGTRKVVHNIFFGHDEAAGPQAGSLVDNLTKGLPLTTDQIKSLNVLPGDFVRNLEAVQKDPQAILMLVSAYEEALALQMAANLGSALVGAIQMAEVGKNKPGEIKLNLTQWQQEALMARAKEIDDLLDKAQSAQFQAHLTATTARVLAYQVPRLFANPLGG